MSLQRYRSHKVVDAARIVGIRGNELDLTPQLQQSGCQHPYLTVKVSDEYLAKHQPYEGGYYILYPDGYESFSPAKAFEDGYSLVESEL